eukprot:Em0013g1052a
MSSDSEFVRSCIAAGMVHVLHHPLYTLKSQMMYYGPQFRLKEFISNTIKGPTFLYRGLVPRTLGVMPEKAVKLKVVDFVGHWIDRHGPQEVATSYTLFLARWGVSGAAGGVVTTLVGCPTDRAMVLAQIRKQGFMTVIRETGLKGLYLGWTATLYRDMSFNGTFFALREGGVKWWTQYHNGEPPSILPRHGIGLCAGMIAATISCPFDVIKTRMQGRQLGDVHRSCSSIVFDIVQNEGFKFLFKGLLPRLYVVPSAMAALIIVNEELARFF